MRILFVSQWFQPETFTKGVPFIQKLMQRGHQVQVLTGYPNYPAGKIYEGYKVRLYQKEILEGIPVHRVPLYPSHDNSGFRRIVNYLSFAFSASLIGPWVVEKADVMYVYHPPPTTYVPAFLLKLLKRMPVVLDIQDFWPDTLAATGMFQNPFGLRMVDAYCRFFYRRADKISVLSPGFKRKLIEKKIPQEKIEVIYNWCDQTQIQADPPSDSLLKELSFQGKFNILFAGNMGKAQKLETVLQAARILQPQDKTILFTFIGGGIEAENLKKTAAELQLDNVQFLPARPRHEIGAVLNAADVLLVHLKEDPLFRITIPSKIQAYLFVGKPILVAVPGDASDLVEKAGAGLSCPSENPQRLADSVLRFVQISQEERLAMGRKGREYYQKNLSLDAGADHFERVFLEAVEQWKKGKSDHSGKTSMEPANQQMHAEAD
jgi:colanic acid biosynthesis glycosyl transferase WcaI